MHFARNVHKIPIKADISWYILFEQAFVAVGFVHYNLRLTLILDYYKRYSRLSR